MKVVPLEAFRDKVSFVAAGDAVERGVRGGGGGVPGARSGRGGAPRPDGDGAPGGAGGSAREGGAPQGCAPHRAQGGDRVLREPRPRPAVRRRPVPAARRADGGAGGAAG